MKPVPRREDWLALDGSDTHGLVSVELLADGETPISLYRRLAASGRPSFLLESAERGEVFGRYSFIGFDADPILVPPRTDPLQAVQTALQSVRVTARSDLPELQGGVVGYVGFEAITQFEPTLAFADSEAPTGAFMLATRLVIVDHLRHRTILAELVPLDGDRSAAYDACLERFREILRLLEQPSRVASRPYPTDVSLPQFSANVSREAFESAVRTGQDLIARGEIFQIVLSQQLTVQTQLDAFSLYRWLRALNPSPYMFLLDFGDHAVVGASPEVMVRATPTSVVVRPIAGTRPRGATPAEDEALAEELLNDDKELAEHRMLVDLGRNDVGRVAVPGSVELARYLAIERYSHVMHIVSEVRGTVRPGSNALDVFRACFPAGTVCGAPKLRAAELIGQLETQPRGIYAGAVGYFDFGGNLDTCIAIRTVVVHRDHVTVQAGAGIVHDSVPAKEWEECINKARAPLLAIQMASRHNGS